MSTEHKHSLLQRFVSWLFIPMKDYQQFKEWQQFTQDRADGYLAALRSQHSPARSTPEHSPAWRSGFNDGRAMQKQQERPQRAERGPSREQPAARGRSIADELPRLNGRGVVEPAQRSFEMER